MMIKEEEEEDWLVTCGWGCWQLKKRGNPQMEINLPFLSLSPPILSLFATLAASKAGSAGWSLCVRARSTHSPTGETVVKPYNIDKQTQWLMN
jgi:hypothetical protein